jgi:hypothetical protein
MRTREQRIRDWYSALITAGFDHESAIEAIAFAEARAG